MNGGVANVRRLVYSLRYLVRIHDRDVNVELSLITLTFASISACNESHVSTGSKMVEILEQSRLAARLYSSRSKRRCVLLRSRFSRQIFD